MDAGQESGVSDQVDSARKKYFDYKYNYIT